MKKSCFPAAVLLLCSMAAAYPAPGPAPVFDWVGYPESGNPELINPAGFSFVRDIQLRFGYAVSDSAFEGFDRVSIALPGGGLSGWWEDRESMRKFTLSSSFQLFDNTASLGASYAWFDPTVESAIFSGKDIFTVGMTIRPIRWFSLGMVRRGGVNLPGDDDVAPSYRAGLGVRPAGNDLTFTLDLETGDDFDDYSLSAGAEVRPIEGLAIRAGLAEDRLSLGLETGLGTSSLSFGAQSDDDYRYGSSRGEVMFTPSPGENILRPRGVYVRFEPGEFDEMRQRPFLSPVRPCFTEVALLLLRIASDSDVSGVIVDIRGSVDSPARAEELRYLLQGIRDAGKSVHVYMEDGSSDEYYLASVGTSIYIHPAGAVAFTGVASEAFFLRDFLDRIGIYPDFQHIGRFKSASDMLTRSNMSEAQRTATTELLGSFQDELTAGVANGRGLEPAQLRTIMETGPYTAERARSAGMVDDVCYRDRVAGSIQEGITILSLDEYASTLPPVDDWGPSGHIAVVTASGSIMRGESGSSFPFGRVMGSETVCDALKQAASRPGVRAVILRIDSGGGDALASADMHNAVMQVMEDVPVIVSMGGVAASGGYYMACGADRIFADRMTVTGSVGIISGKFAFGDMLDSLGINTEEVATGPMASMYSPFHRFSEDQRERAYILMEDGYNLFVETVARGRDMTFEEVDSIGRGRVWSGSDALEVGLVDQLGGVADAVAYAAGLAGIDGIPEVRIYPTPEFPGTMEIPGFGVSEDLVEFMGRDQVLYLMQPLRLE